MDKKHNIPQFIIVSGNGRNSGKTSFICRIIEAQSKLSPIVAVKVSPHFHEKRSNQEFLFEENGFNISIEKNDRGTKDTSRMLAAGASMVYYIESKDDHIKYAIEKILPLLPTDGPVICESAGVRDVIIPSLFIMINRNDGRQQKESFLKRSAMADKIILFDGNDFDTRPEQFSYVNNSWNIR